MPLPDEGDHKKMAPWKIRPKKPKKKKTEERDRQEETKVIQTIVGS